MGTPFIALQEPSRLDGYNPNLPATSQPAHIPRTFRDAMRVREEVFVSEQGWPLGIEFDSDDTRSCHWVVYASIKKTAAPAETTPIGTIRITPFPHPPHPPDGGVYHDGVLLPPHGPGKLEGSNGKPKAGAENGNGAKSSNGVHVDGAAESKKNGMRNSSLSPSSKLDALAERRKSQVRSVVDDLRFNTELPYIEDRPTTYHDGQEPYVKLCRMAVAHEFRGHGIAIQLWNAAREWLIKNPGYFNPSVKEMGMDRFKEVATDAVPEWKGLVCVHAQEPVIKVYERWGFKVDEGMGRWIEQGVPHVGMFQRLPIGNKMAIMR
ncbi:hypothetical protein F5Y18DRAFT_371856 [Xylariaceae sp. FL1019]|nr:hypothetical protein F5Y18DRAFT_371856 [Xylariaceae sp. FL1019]